MTELRKLLIGVLLPVLVSAPAAFICLTPWRFGPGGQLLTILGLVIILMTVAVLNLWVLLIRWKKSYHCFLAGMCVPTATVVFLTCWRFLLYWSRSQQALGRLPAGFAPILAVVLVARIDRT